MSKRNMTTARALLESVWTNGDLAMLPELVHEEVSYHAMPMTETLVGIDQYRHLIAVFKGLYADLAFTIEDQFAGGDKVATRWIGRTREAGADGDDEALQVRGMTITQHDDSGRIIAGWDSWDTSKIMQSAGNDSILKQLSVAI